MLTMVSVDSRGRPIPHDSPDSVAPDPVEESP